MVNAKTGTKPAHRGLVHCAIYTRKSTEEGLEQDFNSLDAQREACEAYIRSQAGEGWKLVRGRYDDGGYSGGSVDRPALDRLLADIRFSRIDTVVVYKVDRLTRSLADFAKIVEVFDACGVCFVSVTQQFNTTTSMGRLTLNMLLSFAQFEREVTGERIRDKIAASKKKGLWMGGNVPLGYEAKGRTLTINEAEAETVRTIFRLYLRLGTVRRVKAEADRRGLTTKVRPGADGRMRGGRPLSRGHIYKLLGNPVYVGRIAHRGKTYPGLHEPIVDRRIWDAVQAGLASKAPARIGGGRRTEPSPLLGKLFDEAGHPLTPTHAVKSGRRYRYYVSRHLLGGTVGDGPPPPKDWRLPAGELERAVRDAGARLLADRAALVHAARETAVQANRVEELLASVGRWSGDPLTLVRRVELGVRGIALDMTLSRFAAGAALSIRQEVPLRIRRRGVEMKLVLEGAGGESDKPDAALVKALARAHRWFDELAAGRAQSTGEIAKAAGVTPRYVSRLMPLAFLAPDIVEAILAGTQPPQLTAEALIKRTHLPLSWADQRTLLGFG